MFPSSRERNQALSVEDPGVLVSECVIASIFGTLLPQPFGEEEDLSLCEIPGIPAQPHERETGSLKRHTEPRRKHLNAVAGFTYV